MKGLQCELKREHWFHNPSSNSTSSYGTRSSVKSPDARRSPQRHSPSATFPWQLSPLSKPQPLYWDINFPSGGDKLLWKLCADLRSTWQFVIHLFRAPRSRITSQTLAEPSINISTPRVLARDQSIRLRVKEPFYLSKYYDISASIRSRARDEEIVRSGWGGNVSNVPASSYELLGSSSRRTLKLPG
jgi:hypothetical protein